jgi:hypothetical protein
MAALAPGSRILLLFTRCRLGCAGAREPDFVPFFNTSVCNTLSPWLRWRQGAEFAPFFNTSL